MLTENPSAGKLTERQPNQIRDQLEECAAGLGGEVSVRQRAARLAETISGPGDEGRAAFLRIVATEFGPDPKAVEKAHAQYQAAIGGDAQWSAESKQAAPCVHRVCASSPSSTRFRSSLVDMRGPISAAFPRRRSGVALPDRELEARLGAWFDVDSRVASHFPEFAGDPAGETDRVRGRA